MATLQMKYSEKVDDLVGVGVFLFILLLLFQVVSCNFIFISSSWIMSVINFAWNTERAVVPRSDQPSSFLLFKVYKQPSVFKLSDKSRLSQTVGLINLYNRTCSDSTVIQTSKWIIIWLMQCSAWETCVWVQCKPLCNLHTVIELHETKQYSVLFHIM